MEKYIKNIRLKLHFLPLILVLAMVSCIQGMDPDTIYKVSEGYMIDEYVQSNSSLSICKELIDMSTYSGMLHGYGSYTFFAPTDEAFKTYLASIGKTDISQLTQEEANTIIKYHVIRDSVKTTDLIDGRLPSPTISGKYLTSKVESDSQDNAWYVINRQGKIVDNDISCDNGVVQVVDAVLIPPAKTIMQTIASLPDNLFSVSKHFVMKYSSFCPDSMSAAAQDTSWLTFLIQDNISYIDLGVGITQAEIDQNDFASIESKLLTRLRNNQPSEKSDTSLMNQYVDYHFIKSLKYVSDLLYISAIESAVKNQALSFKLNGDVLRVNYFEIGSTIEQGVLLNRESEYSDLSCSNGVIHYIGGQIEIKNRAAYRVYWDLAEQPENMALKDFRKSGCLATYAPADLSEVEWGGSTIYNMTYYCTGAQYSTTLDTKNQHVYGDYMRFRFSPNINSWFEWKLPMLVAGTYKVWLCWRREQTTTFRTIFRQEGKEDQVLPYVFDLGAYSPVLYKGISSTTPVTTEEANLADGWKQYAAKAAESVVNSKLLGKIVVETTGRHTLRFENLTGRSGETSWDMIQFIPVDEDQLWPRVDMKGKWVYQNTPDCEIWPYNVTVAYNYQASTCTRP
jgi:uncharacterized surface protein with fasciclin (FAS1) repeats